MSDRLLLLLTAVGLKPDMDEYTVFVHRVVRSLEAAGLDEAAEEIRRTLLPAPDECGDEGPEGGPSSEGGTTGPWSAGFPDPESSPSSNAAAAPDADADTGRFKPGTAGTGTGEQDQSRWETSGDNTASPHFWETSHTPHRPTAPRTRDEDYEDGN
ncbi:hypothetical protein AB0G60_18330 [Streptomyces angustmyceticus]|uniref:Uncharacterized protein n=1 Tax=Streptomyces angustmyceticus TaxID=285578 RepID=A0A5J4LJC5_9ACTN|nr:hypothetical protein [Streptomyces angustmyceticus]GES30365.1 hypothetical protein San01_28520 [Streptomyces angustmyceticus]